MEAGGTGKGSGSRGKAPLKFSTALSELQSQGLKLRWSLELKA